MNDKGYHYIIDMIIENGHILKNSDLLKTIFEISLTDFTILKYAEYKFNTGGSGVTGFFLLSESHCSYHTYPENNYIAIDIFTCGKDPIRVVDAILVHFSCTKKSIICLQRGSESIQSHQITAKEHVHETY